MVKFAKKVIIFILIAILILAIFRNSLCRFLITSCVAKATGLKLTIEDINLDVLGSSLYLRGITLLNPPGFKHQILGKAKEITIKYDLLASLNGRLCLRQVKAQISEINIVRNEKGDSNFVSFKKNVPNHGGSSADVLPGQARQRNIQKDQEKRSKFLINRLELLLEKITFIDYKANIGETAVIVFTMEEPCILKNVNNFSYVVDSISAQVGFKNLFTNLFSYQAK